MSKDHAILFCSVSTNLLNLDTPLPQPTECRVIKIILGVYRCHKRYFPWDNIVEAVARCWYCQGDVAQNFLTRRSFLESRQRDLHKNLSQRSCTVTLHAGLLWKSSWEISYRDLAKRHFRLIWRDLAKGSLIETSCTKILHRGVSHGDLVLGPCITLHRDLLYGSCQDVSYRDLVLESLNRDRFWGSFLWEFARGPLQSAKIFPKDLYRLDNFYRDLPKGTSFRHLAVKISYRDLANSSRERVQVFFFQRGLF